MPHAGWEGGHGRGGGKEMYLEGFEDSGSFKSFIWGVR